MRVTINFGLGNSLTKDLPQGTTVSQVLSDASIRTVLGFGSNVQGLLDGVAQPGGTTLHDGEVLTVSTLVGSKA